MSYVPPDNDEVVTEAVLSDVLDELTAGLAESDDPEQRAKTALLIAKTHREIEETREVRKRASEPWWSGRPFQLGVATIVAAAAITAFFLPNLAPIFSADAQLALRNAEIALRDAEIAKKEAELGKLDAEIADRETERVREQVRTKESELASTQSRLANMQVSFEEQLREARDAQKTTVDELQRQVLKAQQSSDASVQELRARLEESQLELARLSEVSSRTESVNQDASFDAPLSGVLFPPHVLQLIRSVGEASDSIEAVLRPSIRAIDELGSMYEEGKCDNETDAESCEKISREIIGNRTRVAQVLDTHIPKLEELTYSLEISLGKSIADYVSSARQRGELHMVLRGMGGGYSAVRLSGRFEEYTKVLNVSPRTLDISANIALRGRSGMRLSEQLNAYQQLALTQDRGSMLQVAIDIHREAHETNSLLKHLSRVRATHEKTH